MDLLRTPLAAAQIMVLERMKAHKADMGYKSWTHDWYAVAGIVDPDKGKSILQGMADKREADKAAKKALKEADEQSV